MKILIFSASIGEGHDLPARMIAEGINEQPIIDGILRGRLNGSSSVGYTITFNGCGEGADFDSFGIEDDVPVSRQFLGRGFTP